MGGNMTDRENPDMQQPGGLAAEAVQETRLAANAEAVAEGTSAEAEDATALSGGGEERAQRRRRLHLVEVLLPCRVGGVCRV